VQLLVVGEDDLTTFVTDALAFEPVQIGVAPRDGIANVAADVLIVDFERAPPIDQLRALRERGWRGALFAIGNVAPEVQQSLGVSCVLSSKLTSKELKRVVRSTLEEAGPETPR
jgi:hypothetical protein